MKSRVYVEAGLAPAFSCKQCVSKTNGHQSILATLLDLFRNKFRNRISRLPNLPFLRFRRFNPLDLQRDHAPLRLTQVTA